MKVVAILQARMGSTRLPGKVMLPLAGKPMVQNIVERVQRSRRIHEVMVTCPIADVQDFIPIIEACRERNAHGPAIRQVFIDAWSGDPNDLVGRYLECAIRRNADLIVRVPCDNPCVDPEYIDQAVTEWFQRPYNFYSNTTGISWIERKRGRDSYSLDGVGCEVVSMSTLKWLDIVTRGNAEWREHPHKYWEDFTKHWDEDTRERSIVTAKDLTGEVRLDVNTQADYDFIKSIYDHFGHNRFTTQEVLACPPVQERLRGPSEQPLSGGYHGDEENTY